jgi:hypothetical protein
VKAIIHGRRYDTETAQKIATYSNGGGCNDFRHFEESLYRTKRGSWFIAGSGGPMTHYARSVDQNAWSGGEGIHPHPPAEAQWWLEHYEFTAELEQWFGLELEDA